MAYINVEEGVPGIRSLALFRPETGKPIYALVQILLRGESPLTEAERELIAAYVSSLNECKFCTDSHSAAARYLYKDQNTIVDIVLNNYENAAISKKLKALLNIAGKVQKSGKAVTSEDIAIAREHGAIDRDIHDTVLIAATFCMLNRYVDGLDSLTPTDPAEYAAMGKRLGENGYTPPKNL
jgi:uncharacterized peroxidase-related enzyme